MKRQLRTTMITLASAVLCFATNRANAQYAVEVRSYDAGTTPAIEFGSGLPFNLTSSALGEPSRYTSDPLFPGVVSPFSAPYKRDQLLSVGESGHVTLRLSNYALPQPGGHEIGVFGHASLIDVAYPAGQAGDPAAAFGVDSAFVEVSEDGTTLVCHRRRDLRHSDQRLQRRHRPICRFARQRAERLPEAVRRQLEQFRRAGAFARHLESARRLGRRQLARHPGRTQRRSASFASRLPTTAIRRST